MPSSAVTVPVPLMVPPLLPGGSRVAEGPYARLPTQKGGLRTPRRGSPTAKAEEIRKRNVALAGSESDARRHLVEQLVIREPFRTAHLEDLASRAGLKERVREPLRHVADEYRLQAVGSVPRHRQEGCLSENPGQLVQEPVSRPEDDGGPEDRP